MIELNEEEFRKFLRKKGKKLDVVDRNVKAVNAFVAFLKEVRKTSLDAVTKEDIEAYVEILESEKKSAKGSLYVLMNYFRYIGNTELLKAAGQLRESRTKKSRRVFPLREFLKGCNAPFANTQTICQVLSNANNHILFKRKPILYLFSSVFKAIPNSSIK